MVAPEHVRALAPDENASLKPLIRQGLEQLQRASKAKDYVDLSQQQVDPGEIAQALQQPAGTDFAEPTADEPVVELEPEEQIPAPEEMAERLNKQSTGM